MKHSPRVPALFSLLALFITVALVGPFTASAAQQEGRDDAIAANSYSEPSSVEVIQLKAPDGDESVAAAIQRLEDDTGGTAVIRRHRATDVAAFVQLPAGSLVLPVTEDASATARAEVFFREYGAAFGIQDAASQLVLVDNRTDDLGAIHLVYGQVHQSTPVFAALLRVHFNAALELTAVNGIFVPDLAVSTTPTLTADAAASRAVTEVSNDPNPDLGAPVADLGAAAITLYVYRDGLLVGIAGTNHLVYEVEVVGGTTVREFVYVDAHLGTIVNRYSGTPTDLYRIVYEQSPNPANIVWEEGDPFPGTLNQDQQNIVKFTEDSYYLFFHAFEQDSYDNTGAQMRSVNNDPTISCPNANWNGSTTNYCNGVTADDVVAHEWGHAYTEYNSNLIYQWQSGALNESYSDIWGEIADTYNLEGTDIAPPRTVGQCAPAENSYRWLIGEDATAFGGAIRDMWTPTCYNDPGKVTDSQYHCAASDNGGVHINSGVPNHAFSLLVDGGTYNGTSVGAIGWVKAAHIFWRTQEMYLGPASDFPELADGLMASCTDLTGIDLEQISVEPAPAGSSGQIIGASDCDAVAAAIAATELYTDPSDQCQFEPILDPNAPPLCEGYVSGPTTLFMDDFETNLDNWTLSNEGVFSGWTPRDWELKIDLPGGRPGAAAYGIDPDIGTCDGAGGDESGVMHMDSLPIAIPTDGSISHLAFDHYVATELNWDGGNIKLSINGGAWTVIPPSAYLFNPYNAVLASPAQGNTNPLAGQPAFTGTDEGQPGGSWGQSQIDLEAVGVAPGDSIRVRYDMGVDGCTGIDGWYVDDFRAYTCTDEPTAISLNTISTVESTRALALQAVVLGTLALSVGAAFVVRRRHHG